MSNTETNNIVISERCHSECRTDGDVPGHLISLLINKHRNNGHKDKKKAHTQAQTHRDIHTHLYVS